MELEVGVVMDIRRMKAIKTGPDRNQSKMYGNGGSSVAFFSLQGSSLSTTKLKGSIVSKLSFLP